MDAAPAVDAEQQGTPLLETDMPGQLSDVDAFSATDAWAVGYVPGVEPLVLHWDGETWNEITVPLPEGATSVNFSAVTAIGADDVWVVGTALSRSKGMSVEKTRVEVLFEHWDGASWTMLPGADLGERSFPSVYDVSASSADDVWAVGSYNDRDQSIRPLIEHWDGMAWSRVEQPRPPRSDRGVLSSVTAVSPTEAWSAGYTYRLDDDSDTLVARWGGKRWGRVEVPGRRGSDTSLVGISAAGDSVFAVGNTYGAKSLLTHWDGSAWIRDKPPAQPDAPQVAAVHATSPIDAWITGYAFHGRGSRPMSWHWEGQRWTVVDCPAVEGSVENILVSVSATASDDAWSVGHFTRDFDTWVLIQHWDGSRWQRWTAP